MPDQQQLPANTLRNADASVLAVYGVPGEEELRRLVFEALGEASMCWSERPKGVFDSVHAKRIGDELIAAIKRLQGEVVDPATALFAFAGWLTSRDEVAGPFSARHLATPAAQLVQKFCDAQGWKMDDERYTRQIKLLKQKYPD